MKEQGEGKFDEAYLGYTEELDDPFKLVIVSVHVKIFLEIIPLLLV